MNEDRKAFDAAEMSSGNYSESERKRQGKKEKGRKRKSRKHEEEIEREETYLLNDRDEAEFDG